MVPALRRAVIVLALTLAGALVIAAARALADAAGQGYWAAGYWRVPAAALWHRFDEWAPGTAAAAVALAALHALWIRWRGRAPAGPRAASVRVAVAVLMAAGALRALGALDAWRSGDGPNLVLVSIDTLRADRLGAYGYARPTSPALDHRVAAAGVTFEEVYSQSPKTTPSHMTLFTSLYPSVHGVELWAGREAGPVLSPKVHTLAEVLQAAGYATAAFTGGGHVHRTRGFDQGFQIYKHGGELARALAWLDGHHGRKFFLFFHTYQVHDPYLHPLEYVRLFDADYRGPVLAAVERLLARPVEGPKRGARIFWGSVDRNDPADVGFVKSLYDAGIRRMDETTLTPLLDRLDTLGLARDTLVVFTSDHGEAFGEHGRFLHDDLYTGTLRVPLVLRFPGRLPAGRRVAERASLIDVMPTVLELLGITAPPGLQGRSLTALLRGTDAGPAAPGAVSEYRSTPDRVYESVRDGQLSYIVDGAEEQLFDLDRDPDEQWNVAASRPAAVAAMRDALGRWREQCRELAPRLGPRGEGVRPDDETVRQLRALGYLQ